MGGGGRASKAKIFKGKYKAKLGVPEGRGRVGSNYKIFVGRVMNIFGNNTM